MAAYDTVCTKNRITCSDASNQNTKREARASLFFLSLVSPSALKRRRDVQRVRDEPDDPERSEHDEHADDGIQYMILPCFPVFGTIFADEKLVHSPDEINESGTKEE